MMLEHVTAWNFEASFESGQVQPSFGQVKPGS